MKFVTAAVVGAALLVLAGPIHAEAPGLGTKVYGTEVDRGSLELETRYGLLTGGPEDGGYALAAEVGYGFTDRLNAAVVAEVSREPGHEAELDELSIEALYRVATLPGDIDFAVYGEYARALGEDGDALEFRALFDKVLGPIEGRLNLILEQPLGEDGAAEFGYAAALDTELAENLRVGVQAFGGEDDHGGLFRSGEHFIGPAATLELGGVELEAGYLFAAGEAREEANGQFRLRLSVERPL